MSRYSRMGRAELETLCERLEAEASALREVAIEMGSDAPSGVLDVQASEFFARPPHYTARAQMGVRVVVVDASGTVLFVVSRPV